MLRQHLDLLICAYAVICPFYASFVPCPLCPLCSSYCLFTPNVYISVSVDAHNGYHGFITVIFRKVTLAITLENQVQTHSQLSMLTLTLTLSVNTSAKTPHHS